MKRLHELAAVALLVAVAGCGDKDDKKATATDSPDAPVVDPGDDGNYEPKIDPADFVEVIDNPYLPFAPGSSWVYEGTGDEGESERIEVTATDEKRTVMGVATTVVHDIAYVDGEKAEDTFDWFAQDRDGNVWYFGEDTTEFENGKPVNNKGAWEAGVDGALPGIVMPADPSVGDAFRQEYLKGEAEDMAEVLEVGATHHVELGDYEDVLVTEDWTPLEPDVVENKYYAPGVGLIAEEHTVGGKTTAELVDYKESKDAT